MKASEILWEAREYIHVNGWKVKPDDADLSRDLFGAIREVWNHASPDFDVEGAGWALQHLTDVCGCPMYVFNDWYIDNDNTAMAVLEIAFCVAVEWEKENEKSG
jgi:hypothetical protein